MGGSGVTTHAPDRRGSAWRIRVRRRVGPINFIFGLHAKSYLNPFLKSLVRNGMACVVASGDRLDPATTLGPCTALTVLKLNTYRKSSSKTLYTYTHVNAHRCTLQNDYVLIPISRVHIKKTRAQYSTYVYPPECINIEYTSYSCALGHLYPSPRCIHIVIYSAPKYGIFFSYRPPQGTYVTL